MNAAVPIKAAEEGRVQITGVSNVIFAGHHMVELVRIFTCHVTKRDVRKLPGQTFGQFHRGYLSKSSLLSSQTRNLHEARVDNYHNELFSRQQPGMGDGSILDPARGLCPISR